MSRQHPRQGAGVTPDRAPPRTPGWVKAFGIVAAVGVLLAVLLLTGVFGQGHGPGRHTGPPPSPNVTLDDGHTPPAQHGP